MSEREIEKKKRKRIVNKREKERYRNTEFEIVRDKKNYEMKGEGETRE